MLQMVADESGRARVYGMDIQRNALENTSSLLDENVKPEEVLFLCLFSLSYALFSNEERSNIANI